MTLPADYHMHTPLCRHARGEPIDYAAQALELGLSEIGFSDHSPMPREEFDDWRMLSGELDVYVQKVQQARRAYPNLVIKLALEVDYLPGYEDWIRELAARHPWDYLIGSVHYISETWAIDNPNQMAEWERREPIEVWTRYFERLTMAAESGLFDIIGHTDLCKRFCYYPKQDCSPLYSRFLQAAKEADVAIELNTGGLRKDCREIYPSSQIVQLAAQKGVPITFGSDAHAPEDVGKDFDKALKLARNAGYTHACRFTNRNRQDVKI